MHQLIAHFQRIAPTWLLLDADWMQTRQASPYLPACSDVVPIGRLKWFPESKFTGKDNYAWFRFDARHSGGSIFHGREVREFACRTTSSTVAHNADRRSGFTMSNGDQP
jgi:hypothetical protein